MHINGRGHRPLTSPFSRGKGAGLCVIGFNDPIVNCVMHLHTVHTVLPILLRLAYAPPLKCSATSLRNTVGYVNKFASFVPVIVPAPPPPLLLLLLPSLRSAGYTTADLSTAEGAAK
ncbi:uncharacterized protein V6R79_020781 [Siganus canaliculatus]